MRASTIVTVLATTDMHGHVYPHDYFTRKPAARGLAAAATLMNEVRHENPNSLLLDCGDTIQGSPLASVYQAARRDGRTSAPEPMMLAMSHVGYDAMVMGNHELDYGLASLGSARASASFPWLSANTRSAGVVPSFASYLLKVVGGVKVAVIGITTAAIPQWAKDENIAGLTFLDPLESVRRALLKLRAEKPDVILAAVHGGLGRDPGTGAAARCNELPGENPVWELAERFPQLAAIVYGHSHQREPGRRIGGVLVVQPRSLAMDVGRVDLTLERDPRSGRFRLASATSRLLPVTPETKPDPQILELARPYHEAAERDLDTPVVEAPVPLDGARGCFEDSALTDAIHELQLHYAKAQVSFTALHRTADAIPSGPVTRRALAALCVHDDELYAVEGDGRMVRAALENATRYFRGWPEASCSAVPLVDRAIPGYNCDTAEGVEYEIDLTRPVGSRVRNLHYLGAPLRDDEPLRIALSSYRARGSAGYSMFRGAKVVYRSGRAIRDLLAEYWGARGRLPEKRDRNSRMLHPAA